MVKEDRLLTAKQVAGILGISVKSVHGLARETKTLDSNSRLVSCFYGSARMFKESDVRAYLMDEEAQKRRRPGKGPSAPAKAPKKIEDNRPANTIKCLEGVEIHRIEQVGKLHNIYPACDYQASPQVPHKASHRPKGPSGITELATLRLEQGFPSPEDIIAHLAEDEAAAMR